MDSHLKTEVDEDILKTAKELPRDEYGVIVDKILYNVEAGIIFCMVDALNEEAIIKHHEKNNVKCDNIWQIKEI
ncbi:MAG: nickel-binding protein [Nitrososphaeraceae archaeon]